MVMEKEPKRSHTQDLIPRADKLDVVLGIIASVGVSLGLAGFYAHRLENKIASLEDHLNQEIARQATQIANSNMAEVTEADLAPFVTPTPAQ